MLDGELVAGQGRASDFYGVLPRVARSAPLSFVAFDVLAYDGAAVIDELYDAVVHGKPPLHGGAWGLATLEACLAILRSAREQREIVLEQQTGIPLANTLYVGDSRLADVIGAKHAGMQSAWVNRNGKDGWQRVAEHDYDPDFEVSSLDGLLDILSLR